MWSTLIVSLGLVGFVNCDCGTPAIAPSTSKIVGGSNAIPGSWPWQGVFKHKSGWFSSMRFICGGTLIAPNWFMTAAHCVDGDNSAKDYQVVLGVYNRQAHESSQQVMSVKSVHKYNKYDSGTTSFDIALVELSSSATLGPKVSPVCLPKNDSVALSAGKSVIVTGWGTTSSGGSVSSTLRQVTVPYVPTSTCNTEYSGEIVNECMFCAGVGGKDSCQGDSGGPVVSHNSAGKWFQYGIVSWGYGCAQAKYPGVYSRVTDYCDFIKTTTKSAAVCQ